MPTDNRHTDKLTNNNYFTYVKPASLIIAVDLIDPESFTTRGEPSTGEKKREKKREKSLVCDVKTCRLTTHIQTDYNLLLSWCFEPSQPKGLHQGWKQMSIHLLLIPHKSRRTTNFFKIHLETDFEMTIG